MNTKTYTNNTSPIIIWKQQQDDNSGGKQQQNSTTTPRETGQWNEDLNEYLAKEMEERATRGKEKNRIDQKRQPGILELWRAQERLGGGTELADTAWVESGAAKGKF